MSVERIAELWEKATPETVEQDLQEAVNLIDKLGTIARYEAEGYLEGLATLADQVRSS